MRSRPAAFIATLVALLAGAAATAGSAAASMSISMPPATATALAPRSDLRLYVPNQMDASVSILSGSGELLETVDLRAFGFGAEAMPHQVVAAADGSAWYVTLVGDGYIAKFDADGDLAERTEVDLPGMIVLDERRDLLYVSRALRAVNPPSSLAVLRASTLELLEEVDIFVSRPHALAVDPVSGRAYTGSLDSSQIATLDFVGGDVWISNVEGPANGFVGLATSPDGRFLVATTQITDRLLAFDASDGEELVQLASIPVEATPYDVAYSPDGHHVWFPNQRCGCVTAIDARDWSVAAVIHHDAFAEPHGVIVAPDSATVFISSHGRVERRSGASGGGPDLRSPRANGNLAVLDVASRAIRSVTEVGRYGAALGLARR